jgi:hypothetical protein
MGGQSHDKPLRLGVEPACGCHDAQLIRRGSVNAMSTTTMSGSERTMAPAQRRRRSIIIAASVAVVGVVWYLFRPELLFVNKTVNESFPASAGAAMSGGAAQQSTLAAGEFRGLAHDTKGTATIYEVAGGKRVLRLTGFETSNGPDVHVLLVAADDAKDDATVKDAGYIDLGSLKGNVGDQNYDIPADANLANYRACTIWCNRFSVNFGTAPLKMN